MDHQRYLEGYAVVVHSRAEAYPLQGWFERVRAAPNDHPPALSVCCERRVAPLVGLVENITLVMSSFITTYSTLTMGAGLAVGAAVADGELGSVMGSMLLNVHVPTTHTTSPYRDADGRGARAK